MPYAVITVDKIDKKEAGYIHFKCKAQKAWNCNVDEIIADLTEGERYKIDYNETQPSGGRKYGSKYVNRARLWQPEDGPNTWPDKEPYTGGGGSFAPKAGGSVSKDFDTGTSMRQTASNAAMAWCAVNVKTIDELAVMFPVAAELVFQFVSTKPVDTSGDADSGSNAASKDEFEKIGRAHV